MPPTVGMTKYAAPHTRGPAPLGSLGEKPGNNLALPPSRNFARQAAAGGASGCTWLHQG